MYTYIHIIHNTYTRIHTRAHTHTHAHTQTEGISKGSTQEAEDDRGKQAECPREPCARLEPPNQDAGDGAGHGGDHQGTHFQKHSIVPVPLHSKCSEKEQYSSSSSRVAALRVGFQYTFPLAPPFPPRPLPSSWKISLPVSLSLSDAPREKVTCRLWRYSEAGALVFS